MTLVFFMAGTGVGVAAAAAVAVAAAAVSAVVAVDVAVVEVDNDAPGMRRQCAELGGRSQAWSSGRARREREPVHDVHRAIMKLNTAVLFATGFDGCSRIQRFTRSRVQLRLVCGNVLRDDAISPSGSSTSTLPHV